MLNTISLLSVFGKILTVTLTTTSHIVANNVLRRLLPHVSGDCLSVTRQNYSEDGRAQ